MSCLRTLDTDSTNSTVLVVVYSLYSYRTLVSLKIRTDRLGRRRPSDTARARHVTSALERGYKLARPRKAFFWPAFVTRLLTPRSRKSGYGLLLGCRSGLDFDLLKKLFFDKVQTQKPGKSSLCFGPRSQSIGVVELVGRKPLIIARVENGVTKFSPQRQKTPKFSVEYNSHRTRGAGLYRSRSQGGYRFWAIERRSGEERRYRNN